jgi:hypothetical protein
MENGIDRPEAEAMLRALHEHLKGDGDADEIARTIHPDAEMRLLVSLRKPLHGRAEIVQALGHGRNADIFRAHVLGFEWLDPHTSLTSARARYGLDGGGHAEGAVYWLDEFRDDLIWRVEAFTRQADARRRYEEVFEQRHRET